MTTPYSLIQENDSLENRWKNRRATVRYHCAPATVGKISESPDEDSFIAWIHDLSKGGVGLFLNKPLCSTTQITVQISSHTSKIKYSFQAQVMHSTRQVSGDWLIGCSFLKELTDDELDLLL